MKTYRVVHVIENESFVDAESEEEAANIARSELDLVDGVVITEVRSMLWKDDEEVEGLGT